MGVHFFRDSSYKTSRIGRYFKSYQLFCSKNETELVERDDEAIPSIVVLRQEFTCIYDRPTITLLCGMFLLTLQL